MDTRQKNIKSSQWKKSEYTRSNIPSDWKNARKLLDNPHVNSYLSYTAMLDEANNQLVSKNKNDDFTFTQYGTLHSFFNLGENVYRVDHGFIGKGGNGKIKKCYELNNEKEFEEILSVIKIKKGNFLSGPSRDSEFTVLSDLRLENGKRFSNGMLNHKTNTYIQMAYTGIPLDYILKEGQFRVVCRVPQNPRNGIIYLYLHHDQFYIYHADHEGKITEKTISENGLGTHYQKIFEILISVHFYECAHQITERLSVKLDAYSIERIRPDKKAMRQGILYFYTNNNRLRYAFLDDNRSLYRLEISDKIDNYQSMLKFFDGYIKSGIRREVSDGEGLYQKSTIQHYLKYLTGFDLPVYIHKTAATLFQKENTIHLFKFNNKLCYCVLDENGDHKLLTIPPHHQSYQLLSQAIECKDTILEDETLDVLYQATGLPELTLDEKRRFSFAIGACLRVAYLHNGRSSFSREEYFHLDLKPSNMTVNEDYDDVNLVDYGCSDKNPHAFAIRENILTTYWYSPCLNNYKNPLELTYETLDVFSLKRSLYLPLAFYCHSYHGNEKYHHEHINLCTQKTNSILTQKMMIDYGLNHYINTYNNGNDGKDFAASNLKAVTLAAILITARLELPFMYDALKNNTDLCIIIASKFDGAGRQQRYSRETRQLIQDCVMIYYLLNETNDLRLVIIF